METTLSVRRKIMKFLLITLKMVYDLNIARPLEKEEETSDVTRETKMRQ